MAIRANVQRKWEFLLTDGNMSTPLVFRILSHAAYLSRQACPEFNRRDATESKSEIRSSKSETNRNTQIRKSKSETSLFKILCFLIIWICFEFRISILRLCSGHGFEF